MNKDTFERAMARLDRSWSEAEYRFKRRSDEECGFLYFEGEKASKSVEELSEVTATLADNPCAKCKRCCTQAAFSSGFHSHTEREYLLAASLPLTLSQSRGLSVKPKFPLTPYVVKSWKDNVEEPPERCLFLSPTGCNLPTKLKSSQCATYVCLDKLAPQLATEGKEIDYKKARTKHVLALRVIQDGLSDLSFEKSVANLGDG